MQEEATPLHTRWLILRNKIKQQFGIKPDIDGILMLIGVQELGIGRQSFDKEQKQDLMHIAVCTILSQSGYYIMKDKDEDGWPHFVPVKSLPVYNPIEQENFIKDHILLYFQNISFI